MAVWCRQLQLLPGRTRAQEAMDHWAAQVGRLLGAIGLCAGKGGISNLPLKESDLTCCDLAVMARSAQLLLQLLVLTEHWKDVGTTVMCWQCGPGTLGF